MLSHVNKAGTTPPRYSSSLYAVSLCLLCIAVLPSINLKWRCAKKIRSRVDSAEFYTQLNSICYFHNWGLGKTEDTKTITPPLHFIAYCIQMDRDFFFFYKQTGLWMKMLSLIVCGVLIGVFFVVVVGNKEELISSHQQPPLACLWEGGAKESAVAPRFNQAFTPLSLKMTRHLNIIIYLQAEYFRATSACSSVSFVSLLWLLLLSRRHWPRLLCWLQLYPPQWIQLLPPGWTAVIPALA